jgi:hypothetical protein
MRWAGHVTNKGKERAIYRVLVGKSEGKKPVRRPRRRRDNNIKMDLRGTGWGGMYSIHLSQNRDQWRAVLNTLMNLGVA